MISLSRCCSIMLIGLLVHFMSGFVQATESFFDTLGKLDEAIAQIEHERAAVSMSLEQAKNRAEKMEELNKEAQKNIFLLESRLKKHLLDHFVAQEGGILPSLLGAENFIDSVLQSYVKRKMTERDAHLLAELRTSQRSYEAQKKETDATLIRLAQLEKTLAEQSTLLHETKEERQRSIERIVKNQVLAKRAAKDLAERHKDLSKLVEDLSGKQNQKVQRSIVNFKGTLLWPIQGKILRRYRQAGPSTLSVPPQGVRLRASVGTPIKGVFEGTVAYAGWMRGFGRTIILDHGHGVHSVYAHLDNLTAQLGDRISRGQIIGHVGQTESVEGPQLYFEIRQHGMPQDPMKWLR